MEENILNSTPDPGVKKGREDKSVKDSRLRGRLGSLRDQRPSKTDQVLTLEVNLVDRFYSGWTCVVNRTGSL